jgi:hypothetical protein
MNEGAESREKGMRVARRRKKNQLRIDELCREAKMVGLSYGYYVGLQRAGFAIPLRTNNERYKDPHHTAWVETLMRIAGKEK